LANAERSESARDRTHALIGLAYTLVEDDTDAAQRAAAAAVELAQGSMRPLALVAQGWLFLHEGNRPAARSNADAALADGRHRGSPMRIAEALELVALCEAEPDGGHLEEAHTIWKTIGARVGAARTALALARLARDDARIAAGEDELRRLGIRRIGAGAGLLREIRAGSAPPVAIRTLGHFAVLREGDAVGSTEWQSKKARDLLKMLVAQRGHALSRDALLELLWPDDDPRRTSNRLSVALNVVRTVLDPTRQHGQDHYVAGERDALRLVLQHVVVDLEDFLAAAWAGMRAFRAGEDDYVELLESAETAYAGDFLEEDRYEDWASACRDEARAAYADVLRTLAGVEAQGEARSATYHLRALALDPYDEEMHLALVSMLIAGGRHGEARRAYRHYVDRMREIDVEPSAFPSDAARAKPPLSGP
jgi:DNA-binding SARP family transcriptional activator